jgi:hypothetical protein
MLLALVASNSTSTSNLIASWLSPTGLGTVVLALGVFVAAYQIYLDRKDRNLDRDRELRERPHFGFSGIKLETQELAIIRGEKLLPPLKMGLLKIGVENEGEMIAQQAQPFFGFGEPKDESLLTAQWGLMVQPKTSIPIPVVVPPYVGDSLSHMGLFLSESLLGDAKWGFHAKRNIAPSSSQKAICLFTLEGCDLAFHPNPSVEPLKLPLETTITLNVVMENSPASFVMVGRVRLKSWNELEIL